MEASPEDRRLLWLETDAIFGLDQSHPNYTIVRDPSLHAVLNWSSTSNVNAISPGLSAQLSSSPQDDVAHAIESFLGLQNDTGQKLERDVIPTQLIELRDALHLSPTSIMGGPTYIIPPTVSAEYKPDLPAKMHLLRSSDSHDRAEAASCQRPSNWHEGEWKDLVECASHHPWAMIVTDSRDPVCICHTPASNSKAVEAGIWTTEEFRGQGLAPIAVAAWSGLHEEGTVVFYSTGSENRSSQSVARKLGLTGFGYIWKLLVDRNGNE